MVLRPIKITVRHLSPFWLKFVGVLIFIGASYDVLTLSFSNVNPIPLIIFDLVAIAIWTGREIVILDFDSKEVKEGYAFLGIVVHTDNYKFSGIEKMYINRILTAQTFYRLSSQSTIHDQIYKAFIKTNEGDKFCVGQMRDKNKLIDLLKGYNKTIKAIIVDNTLTEPAVIDS